MERCDYTIFSLKKRANQKEQQETKQKKTFSDKRAMTIIFAFKDSYLQFWLCFVVFGI